MATQENTPPLLRAKCSQVAGREFAFTDKRRDTAEVTIEWWLQSHWLIRIILTGEWFLLT